MLNDFYICTFYNQKSSLLCFQYLQEYDIVHENVKILFLYGENFTITRQEMMIVALLIPWNF